MSAGVNLILIGVVVALAALGFVIARRSDCGARLTPETRAAALATP